MLVFNLHEVSNYLFIFLADLKASSDVVPKLIHVS